MELIHGFQAALAPANLFACFVGVLVGTLIGVLPGIGPAAAVALLLPVTFSVDPVTAIIMLAGIYYGAMYGGSTTSILVNIPGEAASVITTLDGYQMALQGRAGPALGIAAFGSFIAGTFSLIALQWVAVPLANVAIKFGPPEYFSLMSLGFIILVTLAGGSIGKGIAMGLLGLALSFIGLDTISGLPRFNFGAPQFMDGIHVVPLIMGLFGISEVLLNIEAGAKQRVVVRTSLRGLLPSLKDWKDSTVPIAQGSIVGFLLGILPGGGAVISSFVSYWLQRKISRHPERMGTGSIEGVAAPEAANNAAVGGSFVPLLILGIPTGPVIAILMGALMIHGIAPGPSLMDKHPDLFWGFVASMYIGNVMLLVLNLPLIPLWIRILKLPYRVLFPLILLFTIIGSYSVNNSLFDVTLTVVFGVVGYLLRKFEFPLAPLIMAFVLGPMVEESFRQSLILSRGSFDIFFSRPYSLAFLVFAAAFLAFSFLPALARARGKGNTDAAPVYGRSA